MERKRIQQQKGYTLSAEDRLALASLLIKAGYSVRLVRYKRDGKTTYQYAVEYWEEDQ